MAISDHDYEQLVRNLDNEIEWTKERARRLTEMKAHVKTNRKRMTAEGWAQVGSDIIDRLTHRSNVHPQTIVRSCAMLAAHAAAAFTKEAVK